MLVDYLKVKLIFIILFQKFLSKLRNKVYLNFQNFEHVKP